MGSDLAAVSLGAGRAGACDALDWLAAATNPAVNTMAVCRIKGRGLRSGPITLRMAERMSGQEAWPERQGAGNRVTSSEQLPATPTPTRRPPPPPPCPPPPTTR